jgi:hypothetical protein
MHDYINKSNVEITLFSEGSKYIYSFNIICMLNLTLKLIWVISEFRFLKEARISLIWLFGVSDYCLVQINFQHVLNYKSYQNCLVCVQNRKIITYEALYCLHDKHKYN